MGSVGNYHLRLARAWTCLRRSLLLDSALSADTSSKPVGASAVVALAEFPAVECVKRDQGSQSRTPLRAS